MGNYLRKKPNKKKGDLETLVDFKENYPEYNHESKHKLSDFEINEKIGEGAYGGVYRVKEKNTDKEYAMKVIKKEIVKDIKEQNLLIKERKIMSKLNSDFIVKLIYAFQDNARIYFILELVKGLNFMEYLKKVSPLPEQKIRLFSAEIILALEYLHENNIIYCDLKPENILMDEKGHIKLCDFGVSQDLEDSNKKPIEFCGTPSLMSPEVCIKNKSYDYRCDWWSLGCLIYNMKVGQYPFKVRENEINENECEAIFGKCDMSKVDGDRNLKDLITKLLTIDPHERLGSNGAEEIKNHEFFKDIDWEVAKKRSLDFDSIEEDLKNCFSEINRSFSFDEFNPKEGPGEGFGYYVENFSPDYGNI